MSNSLSNHDIKTSNRFLGMQNVSLKFFCSEITAYLKKYNRGGVIALESNTRFIDFNLYSKNNKIRHPFDE